MQIPMAEGIVPFFLLLAYNLTHGIAANGEQDENMKYGDVEKMK